MKTRLVLVFLAGALSGGIVLTQIDNPFLRIGRRLPPTPIAETVGERLQRECTSIIETAGALRDPVWVVNQHIIDFLAKDPKVLGGHFKTGHTWTAQNRP